MERIKSKILKYSEQLKEEYEAVQVSLNRLLEKDREAVNDIANLDDKDITTNKKYLLGVMEYQALTIQKLLEIGMELDEFSKNPRVPLHSGTILNSISKSELSLSSINITSETSLVNKSFLTELETVRSQSPLIKIKTENNTDENEIEDVKAQVDDKDVHKGESSQKTCKTLSCSLKRDKSTNNDREGEQSNSQITMITNKEPNSGVILTQASELSFKREEAITKIIDLSAIENCNESSSDASILTNKDSIKKSSADISSSEDVCQSLKGKEKTTQEKFKLKKLMTRRDRFLQNLQRPDIPDLSFKPSNRLIDTNDSYITCPESSSSPSTSREKDRKRKKRRSSEKDPSTSTSNRGVIAYKNPPIPVLNSEYLVSHIISPSEFYINRLDEDIAVIDAISHQLIEIFNGTTSPFPDKKSAMEALGNHCVCYLENYNNWHRVTVINWRLNARDYQEDLVTVRLVDYGHIRDTSYKNLRELSEEFCHVAPCAIKCHLAWLYPPGSTKQNLLENWPRESFDFFLNLFSDDIDAIYKVVYAEKCGNSWGVDILFKVTEDKDVTFGQLMMDNGMAVEIFQDSNELISNTFFLDQIKTAQGCAGITSNMTNEEKLEKISENMGACEYGSIDQAMLRYKATDEARTCKHTRPDGSCFKGKRCKLDHGRLRKDGVTTDKQRVYVSAFKELEMPDSGAIVKLRVVNVVSVNTFYACLINSYSEGLKNLIANMNKRTTIANYKPLEIMPAPGELVIAKSWNNHWYRAKVRDVYHFPANSEETIQVFFVDLGDVVDVKMIELRTMTADFLYLPFQAIFCKLYNVKPIEAQDQTGAKYYTESHFLCQIFDAEVIHASHSTLEVLLRKEDNSEDVGEQIIEDGFGEFRVKHEFPIATETLLVD